MVIESTEMYTKRWPRISAFFSHVELGLKHSFGHSLDTHLHTYLNTPKAIQFFKYFLFAAGEDVHSAYKIGPEQSFFSKFR